MTESVISGVTGVARPAIVPEPNPESVKAITVASAAIATALHRMAWRHECTAVMRYLPICGPTPSGSANRPPWA